MGEVVEGWMERGERDSVCIVEKELSNAREEQRIYLIFERVDDTNES